jgi:uncharacterized protein (TIGR00251 family)
MIRAVADGDAVLVPVRAQPGASRDRIAGEYRGSLKVTVTRPPERGRANEAVAAVLAKALGVRKAAVTLTSGATSRDKVFRVEGRSPDDVAALV